MSLRRAPTTDVTPLEVWDRVIAGQPLFAWQGQPSFSARIVELLEQLDVRDATIYLAGGRDNLDVIAGAIRDSGRRVVVDVNGAFAGVPGAARLAGPRALGVDIGQTSIKAWLGERRVRTTRDWSRLPLEVPGMSDETLARGEDELVRWVRATVAELIPAAESAVIAVPAEVDASCCVAGSSYPYASPNPRLLWRIAEAIGARDAVVCNDAELVAHSAAAVIDDANVLTLTFGWGVGAALLRR